MTNYLIIFLFYICATLCAKGDLVDKLYSVAQTSKNTFEFTVDDKIFKVELYPSNKLEDTIEYVYYKVGRSSYLMTNDVLKWKVVQEKVLYKNLKAYLKTAGEHAMLVLVVAKFSDPVLLENLLKYCSSNSIKVSLIN